MGTIITVDSVVYNMAGEEKDRPNYLKSLVVRNVLSGTKDSITKTLSDGYLNGPGMDLKAWFRWCRNSTNYGTVGLPTGSVRAYGDVDESVDLSGEIPAPAGKVAWIQSSSVGLIDAEKWTDQWILNNRPDDWDLAWACDYNPTTNLITINWPSGPDTTFTPSNFNYKARYLYVYYNLVDEDIVDDTSDRGGNTKVYIYRIGSGNATLDALVASGDVYTEFFPFIPIRLNNDWLSDTHHPTVWAQTKKAYKKLTGKKLTKLLTQLEENDNLDDIDHTYVTLGVSANVKENACKKYIYKFYQSLAATQINGPGAWDAWQTKIAAYNSAQSAWNTWNNLSDPWNHTQPGRPSFPAPPKNAINISGDGDINTRFDVRLIWNFITDGIGSGLGKTGAKKGELWFTRLSDVTVAKTIVRRYIGGGEYTETTTSEKVTRVRLYWQRTASSYTYLDIVGGAYRNFIYDGNAVKYELGDAIEETDDSGFIIPLHYDTYDSMSLIDQSQMATACIFCVFNCYEIRKTKWYESGIFRIFLVIVIAIAVTLLTGGGGFGILGSNLLIGTSMGFSGLTASIVGSVVNAMAALVVSTVMEKVGASLGPIGQLIGALLMMVVGSVASAFQNGMAAFDWSSLLSADNLMKLTNAVGDFFVNSVNADTMAIQQQMVEYGQYVKSETDKIQQAFFDQFGYGAGAIDPNMFAEGPSQRVESSSTFLTRTLLTGSDIANMSHDLLYDFSEYSLKLPEAIA